MTNRIKGRMAFRASMCMGVAAVALLSRAPTAHAANADGLMMDEQVKVVPTNGGKETDITMHVESRGDASRSTMQMSGEANGSVILRPGDGRTIMLMPQQQMYMTMPQNGAAAAAATSQPAGEVTVTDLKKSQKIDGHDTEGYLVTYKPKEGESHEITYWMAKDIPDAEKVAEQLNKAPLSPTGGRGARGGGASAAPNVSITGMPKDAGVPLEVQMSESTENITILFSNIKFGSIPDSDLKIPDGWRDLSAMMGGGGMPNIPNGG
jgi:hypothetical protein